MRAWAVLVAVVLRAWAVLVAVVLRAWAVLPAVGYLARLPRYRSQERSALFERIGRGFD
jgi:hypothetical protein